MRNFRLVLVAFIFTALLLGASATFAAPPESFAPMIEPLMPAVVNISTMQKIQQQKGPQLDFQAMPGMQQNEQMREFLRQFNQQFGSGPNGAAPAEREVTSLGSGFVIDPTGYIVTNNHVVGNATEITVIFQDKTHLKATIVGRDDKTDLALLKVKSDKPLVAVKLGDSDGMRVGDWVIAIGNPFGLGGSVSAGIVSARGRKINAGPFDDFIQTDAAINRGNSGGPLFNTKGEVVGVNSAIFSPNGGSIGIGFAIPSSMVKSVTAQLREYGAIHRGWFGVKIEPVSDELANSLGLGHARGALISDTTKGGPAAAAGLQPGDVVLKYDGKDIDEMRTLPRYVADTKAGKKVDVVYWRKGREQTAPVTIGKVPDEAGKADSMKEGKSSDATPRKSELVLGMQLTPLDQQERDRLSLPAGSKGVVVDGIDREGEAAKRGIRPGDIILEVNQTAVDSSDAVNAAIKAAKHAGRDFALVRVVREKDAFFVTVSVK